MIKERTIEKGSKKIITKIRKQI